MNRPEREAPRQKAFDFNVWHQQHGKERSEDLYNAPRIECRDGLSLSVQASHYHYCTPRKTAAWPYLSVEIGFPSKKIMKLLRYAEDRKHPTQTVYGWVPVELVNEIVNKHGGAR